MSVNSAPRVSRLAVLLVFGAALAASIAGVASASIGATARTASAPATPSCRTSGLVVWLDTRGNGAAGSTFYRLRFTNLSGRACTLFGYPGVSGVAVGGRRLGTAASRDEVRSSRIVTLATGASATSVLRIVDANDYPRAMCRQTTAAGLRVYPPGQTASRIVPFPFLACSRRGPTYLSVQAAR